MPDFYSLWDHNIIVKLVVVGYNFNIFIANFNVVNTSCRLKQNDICM